MSRRAMSRSQLLTRLLRQLPPRLLLPPPLLAARSREVPEVKAEEAPRAPAACRQRGATRHGPPTRADSAAAGPRSLTCARSAAWATTSQNSGRVPGRLARSRAHLRTMMATTSVARRCRQPLVRIPPSRCRPLLRAFLAACSCRSFTAANAQRYERREVEFQRCLVDFVPAMCRANHYALVGLWSPLVQVNMLHGTQNNSIWEYRT